MSEQNRDRSFEPRHAEPEPGAMVEATRHSAGDVTVRFGDGSDDLRVSRREFMRISGVAAAASTAAACDWARNPVEKIVPYVDRPEEVRMGLFNTYATVWENVGVLVRTRAGRPVKLEGNPRHPTSKGALSARGQSSYMSLYDPSRAKRPMAITGETASASDWTTLDTAVITELRSLGPSARVALLTGTVSGSASRQLVAEMLEALPNARHYSWEPASEEGALAANEVSFGERALPHYHFERADLIVSMGADFLGDWLSPVEFTKQFSSRRVPSGEMNKLVCFEGRLSLTGANADERYQVRPSDLVYLTLAIAHEIVVNLKRGPLVADAEVSRGLRSFTPEAVSARSGVPVATIKSVARELGFTINRGLVVAGGQAMAGPQGPELGAAVNLLNAAIGAEGNTIDRGRTRRMMIGRTADLAELVARANAGEIDLLINVDTNPAYGAPPELDVIGALSKIKTHISLADRIDETARTANWLAPRSHYLESWDDALPYEGVYSIQQPAIRPLYDTRSWQECVMVWLSGAGLVPRWERFAPRSEAPARPQPGSDGEQAARWRTSLWYDYLRDHWRAEIFPKAKLAAGFEAFWETVLREGVFESAEADRPALSMRVTPTLRMLPSAIARPAERGPKTKEIELYRTVQLGSGEQANNGHLQELPDPIMRTVWGAYAGVSPATMTVLGLENGSIIALRPTGGGVTLELPVIMVPGTHDDVISVPLGYGRSSVGPVGDAIGENAFRLTRLVERDGVVTTLMGGFDVEIEPTGAYIEPAIPQGSQVLDLKRRPILSIATLEEFKKDQTAGIHAHPPLADFWDDHDYKVKWGMAVDLSRCTGCSACVIACQEENNIPVVGRQGVIEGREMHWLRVDRYYLVPDDPSLDDRLDDAIGGIFVDEAHRDPMLAREPYMAMREHLEEPRVVFQPMLCQHCENAPCETVCPVLATVHSSDGLNQMAYNRCVGTRYCSNNCPFKVRRFNWYNYSEDRSDEFLALLYPELKEHARLNVEEPLPMGLNPEVTVRSRGVMEKCTFCVQRIRRAKWQMKKEKRRRVEDGDVVTACQQTCPANAITFGSLVDREHRVAQLHADPRALTPLSEIGVESSIAYLTRIVNTPAIDVLGAGHAGHGAEHGAGHGAAGAHDEDHDDHAAH